MSRMTRRGLRWHATGIVLALVLVALFAVDRTAFIVRARAGSFCDSSPESKLVTDVARVSFSVANPCFATGMELKRGSVYRFEVEDKVWHDGRLKAGADGLEEVPFRLVLFGPFRRHVEQPWMKLIGQVGEAGTKEFAIGSGLAAYRAETTGELFLYVNDAVFGSASGCCWAWPYHWSWGRNAGTAKVTVSLVHGLVDPHGSA